MVRQADDVAFPERPCDGVLDRPACLLVDDLEHRLQRQAEGLGGRPPGQLFRNRVEQRHPPFRVGGDDRITNGPERDPQPLLLSGQGGFQFAPFGNVLDGQQDRLGVMTVPVDAAGVEQHDLAANVGEVMGHLKVLEGGVLGQDLLEEFP